MKIVNAGEVSGTEAANLIRRGELLSCPKCAATIKTIPENWREGLPLHGLVCPKDEGHFLIHYEDEEAMKEIRARMRAREKNRL